MNLLQLVIKQMRQRALSTSLTFLSVVLGVALATAILLLQREGGKLFGQSDFGYDVLVGPKGNKLQLVLNTAYHLSESPGTIPYSYYEALPQNLPIQLRGTVAWKVPFAVGDNYKGHRIVGTTLNLFGVDDTGAPLPPGRRPEYRVGRSFEIAQGGLFNPRKFQAVIGAEVAQRTGLRIGSKFKGEHGSGTALVKDDEHDEQWEVVGILKPTRTSNDRAIFVPLIPFLAIPAHEEGLAEIAKVSGAPRTGPQAPPATRDAHDHDEDHANEPPVHDAHDEHDHAEAYTTNPDGTINLTLPKDQWRISAILVRSRGVLGPGLTWAINNGNVAMAVNPAMEMRTFFDTFLKGSSNLLLLVSFLVTIVAAVSILVSIYNSVAARRKEVAILRALGATRRRILAVICLEAALVGLLGGIGGLLLGHLLAAGGSLYLQSLLGEGIEWLTPSPMEGLYLGAVLVLATLAGLVPAFKAYQTPVATNLVSG